MINLASASASEIYSAAIASYQRIVIGSTTTGKGTAQVQLDTLAYGQATLTQRKFYRITGGSTQNKGVIPDIKLVDIYNEEFGEHKAEKCLEVGYHSMRHLSVKVQYSRTSPSWGQLSQQRVTLMHNFNIWNNVSKLQTN